MLQENKEIWLHGPFTSLSGDAMEKDVSAALKALTHAGKEFSSLGLSDCSSNCDTLYGEVEELQQLIPLVQVDLLDSARLCFPPTLPRVPEPFV